MECQTCDLLLKLVLFLSYSYCDFNTLSLFVPFVFSYMDGLLLNQTI